jgi:hypothetical protein
VHGVEYGLCTAMTTAVQRILGNSPHMDIEYTCEGCGMRVVSLPIFQPPAHGFCVQCAFLCEYIPDPEEMLAVRRALDADRKDEAA